MVTGHGNITQGGGIVSYYVDGYENYFSSLSVTNYRKADFKGVTQDQVVSLGLSAHAGYPVFKLIDSTKWYLISYVPLAKAENYPIGRTVNVIFNRASSTVSEDVEEEDSNEADDDTYGNVEMRVVEAEEEEGTIRLILESSRYFEGLGELRVADCRIIAKSVKGLLVEQESIVEVDGQVGVYVKTKTGRYTFLPINILGSNDKTSVISDMYYYDEEGVWTKTVDPFDDILKDPDRLVEDEDEQEEADQEEEGE